jgi:hypothetical protein
MNELPLFGLGGNVLLVVILVLLFAEEAGAPLFFIAGDLLLAVGGIAIASGQLSPLVFIPAAFFAIVAGALVGWELFSRLGWDRGRRARRATEAAGSGDRTLVWSSAFIWRRDAGLNQAGPRSGHAARGGAHESAIRPWRSPSKTATYFTGQAARLPMRLLRA